MNFKKNGGFTLVELIVVIAILGLLAGIGIPAYGKYVEKAQIAVDNQNLNMLHNVFVVSCVEHSVDPANVSISKIIWDGTTFGGLDTVAVSGEASAAYYFRRSGGETPTSTKIVDSFNGYIGTEGIQFKSKEITEADIIKGIEEGVETEGGSGDVTMDFAGGKVTFTPEQIGALKDSTFLTQLTPEKLLTQVDNVAGMASLIDSSGYISISQSEGFQSYFANALGIEPSEFGSTALEMAKQSLLKQGYTESEITGTMMQGEINKFTANAMVLYTAKNSSDMTASDAKDLLIGKNISDISMNMNSKDADKQTTGLTQAALAYGMYYSWVNSKDYTGTADKTNIGVQEVTEALGTEEFESYLNSTQGQKDMEGYLAAMGVINSTAEKKDNASAVEDLILNGYNNKELADLIANATK